MIKFPLPRAKDNIICLFYINRELIASYNQTSIFSNSLLSTFSKKLGLECGKNILVSSAKSRSSINLETLARSFLYSMKNKAPG